MTIELKAGLLGTLSVHTLLLLNLSHWFAPNRFNVQAAPSSLEVALVSVKARPEVQKPKELPEKQPIHEERQDDKRTQKVIKEVKEAQEEIKKKEDINSQQNDKSGALVEAQLKEQYNKPPTYPRLARERGYEGKLLVKVFVTKEGFVEKAEIIRSSGYHVLDRSALKSVKKWRFRPAEKFGVSVESVLEIPFVFILDNI